MAISQRQAVAHFVILIALTFFLSACSSVRKPVVLTPGIETRPGSLTPYALREIVVQGSGSHGLYAAVDRLLAPKLESELASRQVFGRDLANGYKLSVTLGELDDGPGALNLFNKVVPRSLTGETIRMSARFELIDRNNRLVHQASLVGTGQSNRFSNDNRRADIQRAIATDLARQYGSAASATFERLARTAPRHLNAATAGVAAGSAAGSRPVSPRNDSGTTMTASLGPQAFASQAPGSTHSVSALQGAYGSYHALIVGNNDYRALPVLETAVSDAQRVDRVLSQRYGFKTRLLLNVGRTEILTALHEYRKMLTARDNLLIYYAGHGYLDEATREGYWLPVNAEQQSTANWLSNATLTASIRAMEAKHVLVVADSCFSGQLTRSATTGVQSPSHLQRMARLRARTALTSGGLEPVLDGGGDAGHSVFATAFLDMLEQNEQPVDTSTLFSRVRRAVALEAEQVPEYGDIRRAGHKGGDFVFVPVIGEKK